MPNKFDLNSIVETAKGSVIPAYFTGDYDESDIKQLCKMLSPLGLEAKPDDTHGGVWVLGVLKERHADKTGALSTTTHSFHL